MLETDTLIQNRYRIVRHVGQGGMGAVYKATDLRLGNTVALKQMTLTTHCTPRCTAGCTEKTFSSGRACALIRLGRRTSTRSTTVMQATHYIMSNSDPRAQWKSRANRRIELTPGNPADRASVLKRNEYVTAAYADMYLRNPAVYKWAGMAALTSAAVGRGMYMIHYLKQSHMGLMLGLFGREVATVSDMLGAGNLAVFEDIYWQHLAYERAGIAELERIERAGALDRRVLQSWRQIEEGRRAGDQALIWSGNRGLLHYEQQQVLQPAVYDGNPQLWKALSGWILSPIPGHTETIESFASGANIGVFDDRWEWIEQRMLPRWQILADQQPGRVERRLQVRMLGGPPFLLPEMLTGKVGQSIALAIGLGSRSGGWVPLARSS